MPGPMLTIADLLRGAADAPTGPKCLLRCTTVHRFGSRDTPRQICRVIEGADVRHDDREFVATNSGKE